MRGTRLLGATLVMAATALLAPAAATAAPPTFTPLLEYGSNGETSLVGSATVTGGADIYYFEVWMDQPSGLPSNIQFESNPASDGGCAAGVQNGRGYVQCAPLNPNATAGTTVTTRFSLPAPYPANGGAQVTMISHPGGAANTTTVNVAGPNPITGQPPPGTDPCEELREKVKKLKEKVDEKPGNRSLKRKLKKAKKKLKECEGSAG